MPDPGLDPGRHPVPLIPLKPGLDSGRQDPTTGLQRAGMTTKKCLDYYETLNNYLIVRKAPDTAAMKSSTRAPAITIFFSSHSFRMILSISAS